MNPYTSIFTSTPGRWLLLAEHLPADLFTRRPAEGEWSAFECLAHVIDTERQVFPVRVRAFLAGQDFPAFHPQEQGTKLPAADTALDLAQRFAALRQENLALLSSLTPADLPRTARHAELGLVTLEQQLNEWAAHDLDHLIQAERAVMQPFIAASGPWVKYFTTNRMATSGG